MYQAVTGISRWTRRILLHYPLTLTLTSQFPRFGSEPYGRHSQLHAWSQFYIFGTKSKQQAYFNHQNTRRTSTKLSWRRPFSFQNQLVRFYHQHTSKKRPPPQNSLNREQCLQMVDFYREWYVTQARPLLPEPPPLPSPPYVARLKGDRLLTSGETYASVAVEEVRSLIERPEVSHISKTLDNPHCTHLEAFEAYRTLPYPGVAYLNTHLHKLLFKHLSIIENKSQASMVRYLSVVNDMKNAGFVITR